CVRRRVRSATTAPSSCAPAKRGSSSSPPTEGDHVEYPASCPSEVAPMMRLFIATVASLCAHFVGPTPVAAQYPTRPISLNVPFAAGGATDTLARIAGEHMAKTLGQAIIIENVPGAG